jgi:hypothetical protein
MSRTEEEEEEAAALTTALRAALSGAGPNGVLVVGPSGSGKTRLVRRCLETCGVAEYVYGNALTVRNRSYFTDMDPRELASASILDFLVPRGGCSSSRGRDEGGGGTTATHRQQQQVAVVVVDDLDSLANDQNHGLDGLLQLLPPPRASGSAAAVGGGSSSRRSGSSGNRRRATAKQDEEKDEEEAEKAAANAANSGAARVVCVCIATGRPKSDKRMLDVFRRCTEVRLTAPAVWDAARGAATTAPAAADRTLYPLVRDLLTRRMPLSVDGLSEPDRVTVGLLFHENVHDYCSGAPERVIAAVAHDHATADAVGTLAHQAQSWHVWEMCFLLRAFRGNRRLFPTDTAPSPAPPVLPAAPSFTKLLTRCSTEAGTRAFLTDMCLRLGCSWCELFPRLAQLDAEFTALVARPAPALLACLRQAGGAARRRGAVVHQGEDVVVVAERGGATAATPTAAARLEWLHRRLTAQLVVSAHARYTPDLTLADVRRLYRCMRAESGSVAASCKKRALARGDDAAGGGGMDGGGKKKQCIVVEQGEDDDCCGEEEEEEPEAAAEEEEEEDDDAEQVENE